MDSLYYRNTDNNSAYKLQIKTRDLKHINVLLDAFNDGEKITKEEFEQYYDKVMTLDIKNEEGDETLGFLTTEYIENLEEEDSI